MLSNSKMQHKMFLGLFTTLSRAEPITPVLPLLQRPRLTEITNKTAWTNNDLYLKIQYPHLTTHIQPMTLINYRFMLRSISGVLLAQIQFRKVIRVP